MEVVDSLPTDQLEDSNGLCVTSSASRPRLDSTEEMPFDKREKEECITVISLVNRDCQMSHPENYDRETVQIEDPDLAAACMLHEDQLISEAYDVSRSVEPPSTLHSGSHGMCADQCTGQRNQKDMLEVAECMDQFSFLGIARNTSRNRVRKKSQGRVDFNAKLYRSRCTHRCHKSRPSRAVTCARHRDSRHQGQGWDGLLLPTANRKLVHKSTCHKYVGETELPSWPLWASAEKANPQWQMLRLKDHLQGQSPQSEDLQQQQLSMNESTGCFKLCCREGLFGQSKTTESIGTRHGLKATQKSETRHRWSSGPQVLCHSRQPPATTSFCAAKSDRGKFMVPKTPRPRRSSPVGRSPQTMPLTTPHKKKVLQTTPAMSALLHSLKNTSMYLYRKIK